MKFIVLKLIPALRIVRTTPSLVFFILQASCALINYAGSIAVFQAVNATYLSLFLPNSAVCLLDQRV